MTLPPLPDEAVLLGAPADDWREAVTLAGRALAASGATSPSYTARMVSVIEEFGAYIVIAPGFALAHARPGPDVRSNGLSVVTLAEPVPFGHPHNDPVRVVVGLAVEGADQHVASVAALANLFDEPGVVDRLAAAASPDEVRRALAIDGVPAAAEERA